VITKKKNKETPKESLEKCLKPNVFALKLNPFNPPYPALIPVKPPFHLFPPSVNTVIPLQKQAHELD